VTKSLGDSWPERLLEEQFISKAEKCVERIGPSGSLTIIELLSKRSESGGAEQSSRSASSTI
jgi:hypothetical protein